MSDDGQNGTLGTITGDGLGRLSVRGDRYDRGYVTLQRYRHGSNAHRVGRIGFRFGLKISHYEHRWKILKIVKGYVNKTAIVFTHYLDKNKLHEMT